MSKANGKPKKPPATTPEMWGPTHRPAGALVQVSEVALVEAGLEFFKARDKRGRRSYPNDDEIIDHLRAQYGCDGRMAIQVLRGMKAKVAERVNVLLPTFAQNVIAELHDQIQEARKAGDHGAAIRGYTALGRFVGLGDPQLAPEQQVRQLSDAALEAALSSSMARALETMSEDAFADLMRRREERRAGQAKPAGGVIDAASNETTD